MKKKKNTKVPACAYGTTSQYPVPQAPTQYQREVFGDKAFGKGASSLASFGDIMGQVPDALGLLASPFQKSTATTGTEAAVQSVSNVGKGAAVGAQIAGTAGAIVGAGVGAIGSAGESASMTSFTDYNEGTLGTGLIGAFGNKGLRRKRNEIKRNAYNNRAAVQGTNYLASLAAEENAGMNQLTTAAQGGMIPSSLAYLDDGELVQAPDGQMMEIPERGRPTDDNLVSLPEGSMVLSDKIKFPGTKKTLAQVGKEMMKTTKSKGKDRYAENANMLNERNNKMIYDQLFQIQEQIKNQRGIRPKTKNLVQAAAKGDIIATNAEIIAPRYNTQSSLPSLTGPIALTKQTELNNLYTLGENRRKVAARDRRNQQKQARYKNITDGIQSVFGDVTDITPMLSNLFATGSDPVQANLNPYAQSIMNTMGGRRFNIDPAMDDLRRNRAISNYNMRNMNTNSGANMTYALQSAVNSDRAISNLRAQESNANNAYLGEYANMANNLGQQYVGATNMAYDLNSQNAATLNNIRRQGMSQLSQYGQNRRLMANQASRDDAMLQLYAPFLEAAYTRGTRNEFNKHIRRGGNNVG